MRIKNGLVFTTAGGGFEANNGEVSDFGLASRFDDRLFARMKSEEESTNSLFAGRFLSEGDGGDLGKAASFSGVSMML